MKILAAILMLAATTACAQLNTNIIYSNPVTNKSSTCPCKFSRIQTAAYIKPAPEWGWKASNSFPCQVVVADPGTNKICVEAVSAVGGQWKGTNSLTFSPGTNWPIRFTLYFKQSVPTNPYPLTIINFNP